MVSVICAFAYSQETSDETDFILVELALIAGQDEMVRVLDTIQGFLDSVDEEDVKIKVYKFLGRELASLGPKHSLFRGLLSNAKKVILILL